MPRAVDASPLRDRQEGDRQGCEPSTRGERRPCFQAISALRVRGEAATSSSSAATRLGREPLHALYPFPDSSSQRWSVAELRNSRSSPQRLQRPRLIEPRGVSITQWCWQVITGASASGWMGLSSITDVLAIVATSGIFHLLLEDEFRMQYVTCYGSDYKIGAEVGQGLCLIYFPNSLSDRIRAVYTY